MTAAALSFAEAVARIEAATSFADLAGAMERAAAYRRLVKIVHPDVAPAGRSATATAALARLSALWAGPAEMLTTRRGRYRLGARIASGDIATLSGLDGDKLLKLPRRASDNDLLRAEAAALTTLATAGEARHRAYAPRLIESFTHEDGAGVRRAANILTRQVGFVSLAEVRAAYPGGLDPRDVAWMWRRLLVGLGWAHRAGVVHGAILPEHVLIHPAEHGLVIVDWCYSVPRGTTIPALVARHRAHYPSEVTGRGLASPATDIYMATGLMLRLITDPPEALRRFAAGCSYDAPSMRPEDAWHLLAEFDELLEDLYGPRRFRAFAMPA